MGLGLSLPRDFAQGWSLEITEPELSELLFQGLQGVGVLRILAG